MYTAVFATIQLRSKGLGGRVEYPFSSSLTVVGVLREFLASNMFLVAWKL